MDIQLSQQQGYQIVALTGEMDLYTSQTFRNRLQEFWQKGTVSVIVDLTDVPYIDSSGLGTLIEVRQKIKAAQGEMYLVGLSTKLKNLFEVTKFDKLFPIKLNREEIFANK